MKKFFSILMLVAAIVATSCDRSIDGEENMPIAISLDQKTLTLALSTEYTELLSATLMVTVTPDNAPNKSVAWSTSDAAVATVSEVGLVTAISKGTATITVTSNADTTKKATCMVTVLGKHFPDANFRTTLVKLGFVQTNSDIDPENEINKAKFESTTSLDVSSKMITSLVGIKYFTNLTDLTCSYNDMLTELDLSNNTQLTSLICSSCKLTELDLSKNTRLDMLWCESNKLTELDLSKNTRLDMFSCESNLFTKLDVSKNTLLTSLSCESNQLTELNLSNNTELYALTCSSNQLSKLDLSANTNLGVLKCSSNQLTELNLSNNIKLDYLWCSSNQLTKLDVRQLSELNVGFFLYCGAQAGELTLTLTSQQKKAWDNGFYLNDPTNANVATVVN